MKNYISIAALAFATLSIPSLAMAQDAPSKGAAPSVSDADAFVVRAEKDLFDFCVICIFSILWADYLSLYAQQGWDKCIG